MLARIYNIKITFIKFTFKRFPKIYVKDLRAIAIGNHMQKSHWKPILCEAQTKAGRNALKLAVSPMDNALHIIHDHLTPDGRVCVISDRHHILK